MDSGRPDVGGRQVSAPGTVSGLGSMLTHRNRGGVLNVIVSELSKLQGKSTTAEVACD